MGVSSVARAEPVADAKDLFARGRELRAHGGCAQAVPLFRKAYALYPSGLGSLRNVAECEESLGNFASARRAWLDLSRALLEHPASRYEGWADDAKQAAARLEPRVAHLTIEVPGNALPGASPGAGAVTVTVNGEPLPSDLFGMALERDPGRYVVAWSGAGVAVAREVVVVLASGESKRIAVPRAGGVNDLQTISERPGHDTPPAAAAGKGASWQEPAAWGALGIGAAGLIGLGVGLGLYQSNHDKVTTACPNLHCPTASAQQSIQGAENEGKTAATLVNIFAVVGAVGVASGIVLFATRHREGTHASLVVTPAGVSVVGRF